jgi:competence protein ComEC
MEFWALGFALSIYLSLQLPNITPTPWLILVTVISGSGLLGRYFGVIRISRFCLGAGIASALAFGYVQLFYFEDELIAPNQKHLVVGEVVNHPQPVKCNPQYCFVKLTIKPTQINDTRFPKLYWVAKLLSLTWVTQQHDLTKGDVVKFTAKLNRPISYENEFGFSYSKWAFSEGVYAKGSIKSDVKVLSSHPKISQILLNKLTNAFSDLTYHSYLYPLILAENSFLHRDEKEQLKILGLSHLFAISGLHIGVLYLMFLFGLRLLVTCFFPNKQALPYVKLISLVLIWAYVGLIDFPVSATRAACLLSVWLFVTLSKRHWRKSQTFCAMLMLTLLLHPPAILAIGWWLSIWAVAGIFVFIEYASGFNKPSQEQIAKSVLLKIKQLILFQVFISIWMLPVTLYWFSGYSLVGLWFNLFMTPLFALFVIPIVFISVLLLLLNFQSWSIWLLQQVDVLFDLAFANQIATETSLAWLNMSSSFWIPAFVITVLFFCFKSAVKPANYAAMAMFITLALVNSLQLKNTQVKMTVLDVGQGTSVIFQLGNSAMIYDLGPVYPSGMSATELVVKPFIIGEGIAQIEKLIISHDDSDHTGNISSIVNYATGEIIETCNFKSLKWKSVKVKKLWPRQVIQQTDNDNSCVVMITEQSSQQKVLLTGDISRNVELQLVNLHSDNKIDLTSDILLSPHHGSRTSSSYPFIKAVSPKAVIHTAGIYNHFGFPAKDVQKRYQNMDVTQYSTSDKGQIDVYFMKAERDGLVKFWRNELSPFWKKQNPFSFQ